MNAAQTPTVNVNNAFGTAGTSVAYADAQGVVRVWDSTAGHFTTCHSLTDRQQARVRRLASEGVKRADDPAQTQARAAKALGALRAALNVGE